MRNESIQILKILENLHDSVKSIQTTTSENELKINQQKQENRLLRQQQQQQQQQKQNQHQQQNQSNPSPVTIVITEKSLPLPSPITKASSPQTILRNNNSSVHRNARKSVQTNYMKTLNSNRNSQCINLSMKSTDVNSHSILNCKKENIRNSYFYDNRSMRYSNIPSQLINNANNNYNNNTTYERKLDFSSLFDYRYAEKMNKKNTQLNVASNSYPMEHSFQPIRNKFYNEIFYL